MFRRLGRVKKALAPGLIFFLTLVTVNALGPASLPAQIQGDSPQADSRKAPLAPIYLAQNNAQKPQAGQKTDEKQAPNEASPNSSPESIVARKVIEKPLTTRSTAHLYELISREPPLSKQEILAYEQNL
ncbi:MAG: hypothetical protein LBF38_10140 [Deltaproteobacteria bacterium]|jgi:hypothetical protein|nr:hypothetical protein [Deltaproteobacteria bacterium]